MISIPHSSLINNSSTILRKYWCHLCKREFKKPYIENSEVKCDNCNGTFCEELTEDNSIGGNHPSNFQPYDSSVDNRRNHISNLFFSNFIRPRTTSNLLDMILEYLTAQNYEDDLENIINHIMMNDPNKYGNPPASKQSVEQLTKSVLDEEKIKSFGIENTCAVCKDEFTSGENCLLMPCQHHFHQNCLIPWLNERNSCPVCRYELPTDDEDFEKRKKQNANNAHSIQGSNSGNDIGSHTISNSNH